ncbi:MAG TPA: dihydrofolate reductase [Pyrinomonadaceae bacterium]
MITGIVAVAENFAIGKDGRLPWYYSSDLKFFKRTTLDSAVVMGFNTWQSIGKPLPRRLNIVLSRANSIENQPSVLLLRSKTEVSALAKYLNCDLYIIGGAQTYKTFAADIEKWIVTEIPEAVENADAFMPPDFLDDFELKEIEELENDLRVKTYFRKQK